MNYFEHHIGDYEQATSHLTACEDGIYGRLIRWYMASETPIPSDLKVVQRRVRARSRDEIKAVETVLAEFFELRETGWHQHRCDEEIARFRDKQAKAKRSADARWNAHRSDSEGNANASPVGHAVDMRTHSEGNAPRARPQTPDTSPNTSDAKHPRSAARGSRLPDGWDPGETGWAFAQQQGLSNGRAQSELAKFRDWWAAQPGQKGVKLDWQATWRTWVRTTVERSSKPGYGASDDIFAGAR